MAHISVFIIVSFVMLLPLYYLILGSFRNSKDLFRFGMDLVIRPELMSLDNYKYILFGDGKIYLHWYKNSVLITFLFTISSLFFSAMVGYALGVYNFKGKNFVFVLVLFVMMIPLKFMLPVPLTVRFKITTHTASNRHHGFTFMIFFRQYASGLGKDLWPRVASMPHRV